MPNPIPIITAAVSALLLCGSASGQSAGDGSQLDELLNIPISTAAKYEQTMSDVAASVTVITAEEIARYGWHTLADVLHATRGTQTTYDRGYTMLGVRGLSLPANYNNRFLVLINGHPLTENVSGSIGIDTTLALDLSQFSRIEFVRGPGSVLYGTGAMLGVINLITKDERERSSASFGAGSQGLRTSAVRTRFGSGDLQGSAAGSWQEKNGGALYFPEFDRPATNDGIVRDRDYDDYASLAATLRWRDFRFLALRSSRTKGVPTASWGTSFGGDQRITDARTTFALDYTRRVDPARVITMTGLYDRFRYHGQYPEGPTTHVDESRSDRLVAELRYVWDIRPDHRLSAGTELVHNRTASYRAGIDKLTSSFGRPYSTQTVYAQLESQMTPRLSITAGASYLRDGRIEGQLTPRLAAIYHASPSSTLKALYGRAFRAPSIYERDYESDGGFLPSSNLQAEKLRTLELIWEQRLGADVLATLSVFDLDLQNLIRLQAVGDEIQHQNVGRARSRGAELQVDHRTNGGIWSYGSLSWSRAREDDEEMSNSPEHMVKAGISTPTVRPLFGAVEIQYETGRLTLAGNRTDSVLLTNVNAGINVTQHLQITTTVRNLFDKDYATPAGPEHRQDVLAQDGRTLLVRLRVGGR